MPSAIAGEVRNFIIANFLFTPDAVLHDDDSFLDQGLIDSTGILELVTFLEDAYGIEITEAELIPDNLDSVNRIAAFLARKLHGETPGVAALEASPVPAAS